MTRKTGQLYAWRGSPMRWEVRPSAQATPQVCCSPLCWEKAGLKLVWRMRVYASEKDVAAAEPLWFLKSPFSLKAGEH